MTFSQGKVRDYSKNFDSLIGYEKVQKKVQKTARNAFRLGV